MLWFSRLLLLTECRQTCSTRTNALKWFRSKSFWVFNNSLQFSHLLKRWTSDELQPDQIHPIVSRLTSAPVCIK
jgi:hypothetical protein